MNLQRLFVFLQARNKEMLREPGTWVWSLIFPIILIVGLAFLVKDGDIHKYKVGVVQSSIDSIEPVSKDLLDSDYAHTITYSSKGEAIANLQRHKIDLVISTIGENRYWINPLSERSKLAERLIFSNPNIETYKREEVGGKKIRYLDWVVSGVLGIVIMHTCLFGAGFSIVRQRHSGVLKRLNITPLSSLEFISAHILSRLLWLFVTIPLIYFFLNIFFKFRMEGSYLLLCAVFVLSSFVMLCVGLLVASRTESEENALAYLNLITWPMVFLSGVWFSLEGAPSLLQNIAILFPLTHILESSRAIMLEGAKLNEIWPSLASLLIMCVILLTITAKRFKW